VTTVLPVVPALVLRSVGIAERRRIRRLEFAYELGLEYFYLLGMRKATRDRRLIATRSRR
jgi:hypothetical protein